MPSLAMLFALFMLPGICLLATSLIVALIEKSQSALHSSH
ncbi:hypothetical protein SAMN05216262_11448 [Colwellia chukchiensis]|uniref:Uncharacterized protein n=1 Tax=Colwellia chukchiensis TaxID=641665 RepID=A0A1H7RCZ1_9GAMM|nr:hypothetical protein SAMN05216262_11448 [Colwellia chukchiensis]